MWSPDSSSSPPEKTYGVEIIGKDESAADEGGMMEDSVRAVERILKYKFAKKELLEQALTHSSSSSSSYERLEFMGDAALCLAISNMFYLTYPDLDPGQLSILRAANLSTEKLARVAVKHHFYKYIKHNAIDVLNHMVWDFVKVVQEEEDRMVVHGGQMKAPKVLADIVESIAGAIYEDCGWDLNFMWKVMRELLEPLVMLKVLEKQPQPITMLFELCNKDGKQVEIKHEKNGDKIIATVYVNGGSVASASSDNKVNAKLHAAEAALCILTRPNTNEHIYGDYNEDTEIEGAKQKIYGLCNKRKWPKPSYRVEQEGPAHARIYISSVQVHASDGELLVKGNKRSRVKDAENSAASKMYYRLQKSGHI
uniref:ribonuclease 3-like protein 2 n=1 Tax=Erigeron canadensis TaxID=72917 RepID=UPI001CB8EB6A|nr:ribonuclease 3-like protein 2 [Erigeron canadensis]